MDRQNSITSNQPLIAKVDFPHPFQKLNKQAEIIQAWLVNKLSHQLKIAPHIINVRVPFAYYGLNSLAAMMLSTELEDWLHLSLSPTLMYDYPCIGDLAEHLAVVIENSQPEEGLGIEDLQVRSEDSDTSQILKRSSSQSPEAIAIVDIVSGFPGAKYPEAF